MARRYESGHLSHPEYEKRVTVRLPVELYDKLFMLAAKWQRDMSDFIPLEGDTPTVSEIVRAALTLVTDHWFEWVEWKKEKMIRLTAEESDGVVRHNIEPDCVLIKIPRKVYDKLKYLKRKEQMNLSDAIDYAVEYVLNLP